MRDRGSGRVAAQTHGLPYPERVASRKIVQVIFRSERGFGHKTRFADSADYHYQGSASTLEMALLIADPQRERLWLQPKTPAPAEEVLLVSYEYRPGTVGERMEAYAPHITKHPHGRGGSGYGTRPRRRD